jgi:hypothetical protein
LCPNSLLIDQEKRSLWFIDWEAARFERGPFRDVEQLLCNLWIMKQNSIKFNFNKIGILMSEIEKIFFESDFPNRDLRFSLNNLTLNDRKEKFILRVLTLIKEKHWELEEYRKREVMLLALQEITKIE